MSALDSFARRFELALSRDKATVLCDLAHNHNAYLTCWRAFVTSRYRSDENAAWNFCAANLLRDMRIIPPEAIIFELFMLPTEPPVIAFIKAAGQALRLRVGNDPQWLAALAQDNDDCFPKLPPGEAQTRYLRLISAQ